MGQTLETIRPFPFSRRFIYQYLWLVTGVFFHILIFLNSISTNSLISAQILSPLGCLIYTGCTGNIYRFIYLDRVLLISLKFPIEMIARESCVFRKYCTRVNLNSYTDTLLCGLIITMIEFRKYQNWGQYFPCTLYYAITKLPLQLKLDWTRLLL